ncbi:hypothetical protein ACFLU6_00795 [Acidobacteriota bacterium]
MKKTCSILLFLTFVFMPAFGKKKPKPPKMPLKIFVTSTSFPNAPLTDKALADSAGDVKKNIAKKRKDWFVLVDNADQAEIILTVLERGITNTGYKKNDMYVKGNVKILDLYDGPISFTFHLEGDASAGWRETAGRMVKNLITVCAKNLSDIEEERKVYEDIRSGKIADLRQELSTIATAEEHSFAVLDELVQLSRGGTETDMVIANRMDKEVIEPWRKVRIQVAGLKVMKKQTDLQEDLVKYMKLREESWTLLSSAFRDQDEQKVKAAALKQDEAKKLLDQLTASVD